RSAALTATALPTAGDPVNTSRPVPREQTSVSPTASPDPWTTLTRPVGAPARRKISSTHAPDKGVSSAGLTTAALPAATAVAAWVNGIENGKFHGETIATTPRGSYDSQPRLCSRCGCLKGTRSRRNTCP